MKFCRNLQRVIDITDPEWAPYWTNYKMLKKFLKTLPSFVPPDGAESLGTTPAVGINSAAGANCAPRSGSPDLSSDGAEGNASADEGEGREGPEKSIYENKFESSLTSRAAQSFSRNNADSRDPRQPLSTAAAKMSRNPGEVAFFRLLNSELRKAIHFFEKAQLEFEIREARVREGIDIMRKANSLMVSEKWSLMAKSLYRLYKDLLLLETYAIMTYCSFSKILKKHDKVTSHNTRIAFMKNVVNKANFTHYPKLLAMISRCETLYEEVSQSLIQEGKLGLYEDERLFINMIHRLNEQVLDTAEEEGADVDARKERRQNGSPAIQGNGQGCPAGEQASPAFSSHSTISSHSASQVSTLRILVEENSINKSSKEGLARVTETDNLAVNTVQAAQALAGLTTASSTLDECKRSFTKSPAGPMAKRARME
ncbi:hypothetical protein HJC23_002051 [Cyclotella cryptica]|uniref:SPX domain-containing protein n=1 Tax=Cyclotella cryptica TaxID=29204 RepID=A0ABD3Q705_9STRA|eukprot:CCRYP_008289-RA/>CCRYP_008289-RA protein AED:0.04 eAED:-0.04 QI:0/-1/0/1/-1/1/1/0/426